MPALPCSQLIRLSPGRLQKTLSAGITQISEKYIEHISLSNLALEGAAGLDIIDPDFIIQTEAGNSCSVFARTFETKISFTREKQLR